MKCGSPYIALATAIRGFMKARDMREVTDLHKFLVFGMKDDAPHYSTCYMAWAGARPLPLEAVIYLQQFGFEIEWRETLEMRDKKGNRVKSNQMVLPGMRELKR